MIADRLRPGRNDDDAGTGSAGDAIDRMVPIHPPARADAPTFVETPAGFGPERSIAETRVSKDVHVLVNPVAGPRRRRHVLIAALDNLRKRAFRLHVHETSGFGDAAGHCRRIPDGHRAVLACGGDGTVREVAEALAGRSLPLIVFPMGTENLAARTLGFRADADMPARLLLGGVVRKIDLARAGHRLFLIVAGVGFDAEIVARLAARRRGHISRASYAGPIWSVFRRYRFPHLCVRADDRDLFDGRGLVFVGNMPRYALGLQILSRAQCDDGLLDLCIYPCSTRLGLLAHSLRTYLRRHVRSSRVIYVQCRRIHVEAPEPVNVELDGDPAGTLPLDIDVAPAKLSVLLPDGQ